MKICPACDARFDSVSWSCPSCAWEARRIGAVRSVATHDAVEGFSAEYFHRLSEVEQTHFWFRARNTLITWAIRRYFPDARTFLEVGCGTGQVTRAIQRECQPMRLTASEAFVEGFAAAEWKTPGIELVQADLLHLPWDGEFDLIGAFDVLEHVRQHEEAVDQLRRALRPGGGVIITVPQHQWLWSPVDDYSKHERRYSRRELVQLLEGAGFRVQRLTSFVSLLLPVLAASRVARKGMPVDPGADYRISPAVNRLGHAALKAEQALIRAGLSLPAGGSLLAVARI